MPYSHKEHIATLEHQIAEMVGCVGEYLDMPCVSLRSRMAGAARRATLRVERAKPVAGAPTPKPSAAKKYTVMLTKASEQHSWSHIVDTMFDEEGTETMDPTQASCVWLHGKDDPYTPQFGDCFAYTCQETTDVA